MAGERPVIARSAATKQSFLYVILAKAGIQPPSSFLIYSHPVRPVSSTVYPIVSSPLTPPVGRIRGAQPLFLYFPLSCDTSSGEGDTGGEVDNNYKRGKGVRLIKFPTIDTSP